MLVTALTQNYTLEAICTMSAPAQSAGKFLHAAKDFRLETRNLPTLSPDDVQVAIRSTTLCGSDLHYYSHFRNGSILVREPLCLGHESSGEITALGSRIHELNPNLQLGDRVALEVGIPCGDCQLCEAGRYNICAGLRFRSSGSKFPHYQGTLQESVVHPARWVYKLPEALSYEVGALLEPLAVAVQAVHRAKQFTTPFAMDEILIIGAGAIGLLTAVAARAAGAVHVVMADIHEGRLAFARGGGFATTTYSVQPRRGDTIVEAMGIARSTAEDIGQLTWPNGKHVSKVQVTFECTGVASSIQTAIYVSIITAPALPPT